MVSSCTTRMSNYATHARLAVLGPKNSDKKNLENRINDDPYTDGIEFDNHPVTDRGSHLRTAFIALAVIALIAAAVGGLRYGGILQLGLTGVGSLSQSTAFWTLIGGGVAAIAFTVLAIALESVRRHNKAHFNDVEAPKPVIKKVTQEEPKPVPVTN